MYKNRKYIHFVRILHCRASKQVGVAIRFVARFGRSKVRALGLVSSGVKEREANRSDVEKERLYTRRDLSGAVRGCKRTQLIKRLEVKNVTNSLYIAHLSFISSLRHKS